MMLKSLYWRIYIVRLSLRWLLKYNLGDIVIFQGQRWRLFQGVAAPRWDLVSIGEPKEIVHAHEDEFRKERTVSNYAGSFRSGYRFYMTTWYRIWMHGGVKPWMRDCQIWGKKK